MAQYRRANPPAFAHVDTTEDARRLLLDAAQARVRGVRSALPGIRRLQAMSPRLIATAAEGALLDRLNMVWSGGWQPSELHRQGRLGCASKHGAALVAHAIANDHARRRAVSLDSRWIEQVEGLSLPAADGEPGWVTRWGVVEQLNTNGQIAHIVDAYANLLGLPRLEPVLPPPGSRGVNAARSSGYAGATTDPVLERIRNLLAKAESTTFEAEATAFTEKAQALMTRHAIEAAIVHGHTGSKTKPRSVRLPIDAPYANVKSYLLQTVAEASRSRALYMSRLGLSTVIGFPDDLAATELLFTSLLVQAQAALVAAAQYAPAGTPVRSKSYRGSFLMSFTLRIGERLREINDAVYAEVEASGETSFLPVLRSQSAAIDDYLAQHFGEVTLGSVRGGNDPAGWASGRIAADHARLNRGELPS